MATRKRQRKLQYPSRLGRDTSAYSPPSITELSISELELEYTFVEPLPDKYLCGICKSVLKEPHVTECCGQHFCKNCLEKSKSKSESCPICRRNKFNHIKYLPFVREIDELKVYCARSSSGCTAKLEYADRNNHDKVCEYALVLCANKWCGKTLYKKDLEGHSQNYCEFRESTCQTCGQVGKYKDVGTFVHYVVCPDIIQNCPNSCGEQFKRKYSESHNSICPEGIVTCDFAEAGCQATPKRKYLDSHMDTNMKQHLSQLMKAHTAMKQEHAAIKQDNAAMRKEIGTFIKRGVIPFKK